MGVTISQAATTLGVSEKTVRRRIKSGTLPASLVGDPPHYEIDSEIIKSLQTQNLQDDAADDDDGEMDKGYVSLIHILQDQLQEKDRQIKELHILLQGSQENYSRMLTSGNGHKKHWWWPFK
jgi:excisionase family DNA binding protein